MKRTIQPTAYVTSAQVLRALELSDIQYLALLKMYGIEQIRIGRDDAVTEEDYKKLDRLLAKARQHSQLMVPIGFAADELEVGEEGYLLQMRSLSVRTIYIFGQAHISKEDYQKLGGRALIEDAGDLDVMQEDAF